MTTAERPRQRTRGIRDAADTPQPADVFVVFGITGDLAKQMVRGTFAGRYVDLDDEADVVIGKRTAEGALTGAVAGLLFGPTGFAVGLVGGAAAGSAGDARPAHHLHDALIDEVRAEVPEKSSAVVLLASPEHADAMIAAFEGHRGRLIRHRLSPQGAHALEGAVMGRPRA
jgi:uncharacterized membrane protein